ncbi:MAG: glycerophosphodiester phosphodiesterase [Oscillospiraceae bacterium]|nr:glycerophosphodiester phosphodiesterase [Oscillospiraceae bacterium]
MVGYILGAALGIVLLVAGIYLFLIAPSKHPAAAVLRQTKYAHRGLHDASQGIPENSLPAFQRAKEAGYGVELDIQFTADRQIVVFHDATLTRLCGVDRRVDSLTYAELSAYTLGNTREHIPLFSEVLTLLGETPLICEIKSYGKVTDTELCKAAYPLLADYKGPFCMESFNPFMVRWFRKNQPQVVRGILSMKFPPDSKEVSEKQGKILTALLLNFLMRPHFIAYHHTDTACRGFRLCRHLFGAFTVAWTVQSSAHEEESRRNFDTIIFENFLPKTGQQ